MRISVLAQGRDNNLNLIRFVAATAVLLSHSYPLALGNGFKDPLGTLFGLTFGAVSVDVFFFTSGFLVTASLMTPSVVSISSFPNPSDLSSLDRPGAHHDFRPRPTVHHRELEQLLELP